MYRSACDVRVHVRVFMLYLVSRQATTSAWGACWRFTPQVSVDGGNNDGMAVGLKSNCEKNAV